MSGLSVSGAMAIEQPDSNIFKADVSNADLALTVNKFENVCMPFVLHKTKLTRAEDRAHFEDHLKQQNFSLEFTAKENKRYEIEPARDAWRPQSYDVKSLPKNRHGKVMVPLIGEIMGPFLTKPQYISLPTQTDEFVFETDNRLSAHLYWGHPSQNHPGKACEIRMKQADMTPSDFKTNFIDRDDDWKAVNRQSASGFFAKPNSWTQCVKQGDEEFLFTVGYEDNLFWINLERDDFFENDLSQKHACHIVDPHR